MATPTYTLIDSEVLASAASSVTFDNIPQDYRDLILVHSGLASANTTILGQFNSDTGSNYSTIRMRGDGSSATSFITTGTSFQAGFVGTALNLVQLQIMDYSATDKHKTVLQRSDRADLYTNAVANRWASTSAITAITLDGQGKTFSAGSTFYLYGIVA